MRDEKVKVLKAIPPIDPKNVVRGQFVGYLQEKGVAPNSQVETFAALQLEIKSWRWDGVPFYIRAGKNLPVTCTEVMARLRKPPATDMTEPDAPQNYLRFRISPEMTIAMAVSVAPVGGVGKREEVELVACRHPQPSEMEAYEKVLTDAMAGDATLFARQDYVEEAWRIVDPVLKASTPVYPYQPHTWGPKQVDPHLRPPCGWDVPKAEEPEDFRVVVEQPA
jgi:glucose-6-phosphate 1-dehydrogenase